MMRDVRYICEGFVATAAVIAITYVMTGKVANIFSWRLIAAYAVFEIAVVIYRVMSTVFDEDYYERHNIFEPRKDGRDDSTSD